MRLQETQELKLKAVKKRLTELMKTLMLEEKREKPTEKTWKKMVSLTICLNLKKFNMKNKEQKKLQKLKKSKRNGRRVRNTKKEKELILR